MNRTRWLAANSRSEELRPVAGPRPRVVYCIVSHINPPQILRLIRTIRASSADSFILVHHDYNNTHLDPLEAQRAGASHVMGSRAKLEWGRFNQQLPVYRALRWLQDNHDYDWFVLISGQDYPARPLSKVEAFLGASPYDGFVETRSMRESSWLIGAHRYLYQYYELPKFRGWGRVKRWINDHADAMRARGREPRIVIPRRKDTRFLVGTKPPFGPFDGGYRCYTGSAWWTINPRCAAAFVRAWERRPDLRRHYERTLICVNESYPHTVWRNDPALRLFDNDKAYVSWKNHPNTGRPDVLGANDFDAITTSGDHFARKFDANVDERILDMVDEHIGVRQAVLV